MAFGCSSTLFIAKNARGCWKSRNRGIARLLSRPPLELCKPREPREGNHIPDVLHSCGVHQESLEAQSEAGMRHRAEFPEFEVPPIVLFRQLHLPNSVEQNIATLFAL